MSDQGEPPGSAGLVVGAAAKDGDPPPGRYDPKARVFIGEEEELSIPGAESSKGGRSHFSRHFEGDHPLREGGPRTPLPSRVIFTLPTLVTPILTRSTITSLSYMSPVRLAYAVRDGRGVNPQTRQPSQDLRLHRSSGCRFPMSSALKSECPPLAPMCQWAAKLRRM